ncbi:Ufm1-specific protease 2 [Balamuthia mandrillaris]
MGWGCAYRSFQTLCSWFVLQRHPNFVTAAASGKEEALVAVPSHKKVQETLFRLGDKPIHFIGSREWIGSYELCLCFDAIFNIKCKILYLASGKEVAGKYDLLRQHFLTHGCPIMIGGKSGGALTLLGVRRWNDEDSTNGNTTGNNNNKMEMLLLDPHYVGPDKPASILVSSQWCSWREPEQVFAVDSFYNFLLPQAAIENTQ